MVWKWKAIVFSILGIVIAYGWVLMYRAFHSTNIQWIRVLFILGGIAFISVGVGNLVDVIRLFRELKYGSVYKMVVVCSECKKAQTVPYRSGCRVGDLVDIRCPECNNESIVFAIYCDRKRKVMYE